MHRALMISLVLMVIAAAFLTVAQIWFPLVGWDTYIKAMITLGVLAAGAGLLIVILSDLGQSKKLKDDHYLD